MHAENSKVTKYNREITNREKQRETERNRETYKENYKEIHRHTKKYTNTDKQRWGK